MKKLNLDIFKILLIGILAFMAYTVYEASQNNRYQFGERDSILDTRTGEVYLFEHYDTDSKYHTTKITEPIETKSTKP